VFHPKGASRVRFHAGPTLPVRVQVVECGPKLVADAEHLELLRQGVEVWNAWRATERSTRPDLSGADLSNSDLSAANLSNASLQEANLTGVNLEKANLIAAYLYKANLRAACLRGADLRGVNLVRTDLTNTVLTGCRIYGVSAWEVKLSEGTEQQDLVIAPPEEPSVVVDNIEVAQFVYLLLPQRQNPRCNRHGRQ
jgi:hypothetical protein